MYPLHHDGTGAGGLKKEYGGVLDGEFVGSRKNQSAGSEMQNQEYAPAEILSMMLTAKSSTDSWDHIQAGHS